MSDYVNWSQYRRCETCYELPGESCTSTNFGINYGTEMKAPHRGRKRFPPPPPPPPVVKESNVSIEGYLFGGS